ncbi:diphthine--ammonia ligase [Puniceicoccaceae bacterium K14]|nr:diphthine--ammonia ligase [Puniceicoccaceae bacterium K14]
MDIALSWSTGKDSLLSLKAALDSGLKVSSLITLLKTDDRVSVHGVRRKLLHEQAASLGFPLIEILQQHAESYEKAVGEALLKIKDSGIDHIAYGDLFLEDIRAWRKKFHDKLGLKCLYPIWKRNTTNLANEFIDSGFKAILTCVNTQSLPLEFAGREFDHQLIRDLPQTVDPCGENGEFHTFVFDGPLFSKPIEFSKAKPKIIEFNEPGHSFTFGFCDLS